MKKELWKGNEAIAEAAIRAGCRAYFGYPITPQNEIPEYMSRRMPESGGVFVQAESEVAAINMVYGAAAIGERAMTSSSSPGISLKQEGLSYMVGAELPGVIVNMMRGGPGLGTIQPGQADYFQATRSAGHGDGRMIVLAPASLQESVDLVQDAFDLAEEYRGPVMILADGMIGQMMEPVTLPPARDLSELPAKPWATTGTHMEREHNVVNSLYLTPQKLEDTNRERFARYDTIIATEQRQELMMCDDAEIVLVAFGAASRIARTAVRAARDEGIKAGLLRPITLWPFPTKAVDQVVANGCKAFLSVELNMGQMVQDVRLASDGRVPVSFYGRTGGVLPTPEEVLEQIEGLSSKLGKDGE